MAKAPTGQVMTYVDGQWHEGNPPVLGTKSHAVWLSSVVFDGIRAMQGKAPDLARHCRRLVESARVMGLESPIQARELETVCWEGIGKYPAEADLYLCPMMFAEDGFIVPNPDSTRFTLSVYESPLPEPTGFSACLSTFRRPARDMAPTDAKASCLYPNVARSVREATAKGFDTGVVLDPNGNVAEFSYANLFLGKGGMLYTPAANGTFLNGITRQRVITLLRDEGVPVIERALEFDDVADADELFCSSNYFKVAPCTRIESRDLQPGPLYQNARELYFQFAETQARSE